ncbi:hypothetical protein F7725_007297 [Dissostichus mawsoni]|uniref:Uncharacterized protein n=1 Tax=Dissostichus mawsoni TaxID=36200 RepID=A0A7J5XWE8_DISMA|nr:hypothetical protein F7725_007297 [Dissostichus mawsoni]
MIHPEFGSKALVNELNALGHCVSYNEVRQFLTSVSADEITRNKDIYIPTGLSGILDHGMIDAAIDNFDQNEETLDEKQTTHSIATVIYRRGQTTTEPQRLARIPQKTLSALNNYDVDGEELHSLTYMVRTLLDKCSKANSFQEALLENNPRSFLSTLLESNDVMDRTTWTGLINLQVGTAEGCTTFIPCQKRHQHNKLSKK